MIFQFKLIIIETILSFIQSNTLLSANNQQQNKMGNSCVEESQNKLEMITSYSEGLEKNLVLYKNDVPKQQYATKSINHPQLGQKMTEILKKELQRQYFQESDMKGSELPPYYITKKKVYYQGEWKKGQPNGKGKIFFQNGTYFEGYFNMGQVYSKNGILIFPDGSFYRGEIFHSTLEGRGRFQSPNNVIYEGDWKDNKPNGNGRQTFSDGNTYEGEFSNGLKHGKGHFEWSDGRVYQGMFENGYMSGKGRYYKGVTDVYSGEFKQNKKVGEGQLKTSYGIYKGPFVDGELSGKGQFKWNDNKIYEGNFRKGKLDGEGMLIFGTGLAVKGIWKEGENIKMSQILKPKSK